MRKWKGRVKVKKIPDYLTAMRDARIIAYNHGLKTRGLLGKTQQKQETSWKCEGEVLIALQTTQHKVCYRTVWAFLG